jgi:hypothetical protein
VNKYGYLLSGRLDTDEDGDLRSRVRTINSYDASGSPLGARDRRGHCRRRATAFDAVDHGEMIQRVD